MGDNSLRKVIGIGDIHIKIRNGKVEIMSNVLHVPGLKNKILSKTKIGDLGFDVTFSNDSCKIFVKNKDQIAIGKRIGNLYSLEHFFVKRKLL